MLKTLLGFRKSLNYTKKFILHFINHIIEKRNSLFCIL